MTFEELLVHRRISREATDSADIGMLRELAHRSMADSAIEQMSVDGRFERAYSAARALATIVIRTCGYRVRQPGGHYSTFLALEAADPVAFSTYASYFDTCRRIRNELTYDSAGIVTDTELDEILRIVPEFEQLVDGWLAGKQSDPA